MIISVPSFGHKPFAELLAPVLEDGQTVMWVSEGGGAFESVAALRRIGRRPAVKLAETNTLPYNGSMVDAPGSVSTAHKIGGTYVSGLPTRVTEEVAQIASQIWPWAEPATNAGNSSRQLQRHRPCGHGRGQSRYAPEPLRHDVVMGRGCFVWSGQRD